MMDEDAMKSAMNFVYEIQLWSIAPMIDKTVERIDPLSVQVRSDWHGVGEKGSPVEYCILLTTGGPAVRIVGDLNQHNEPATALLQCQNWYTPWETVKLKDYEDKLILEYANSFYYGE
jgi:hypothetical protein